jgi:AP2-like factor (ANT lineage)
MMWSENTGEHQQQQSANNNNNGVTLVASSSRNPPIAASPKCSVGLASDFGLGSESYSQGYFPLQGGKHQVPMFALWND